VRDTGSSGDVSNRGAAGDVSVNGHRRYLTADKAIWNVTARRDVTSHIKDDTEKGGADRYRDRLVWISEKESFDDS
jgi:hypothetical protein